MNSARMKKLKKPGLSTPSSGFRSEAVCPICKGDRFVCENHPRLAWPSECGCGAGDPCPVCNIAAPTALPANFVVDQEADDAEYEALIDEMNRLKTKNPPRH